MSLKYEEVDPVVEAKTQIKIMRLLNELVQAEKAAKKPLSELELVERTITYIKSLQSRLKHNNTAH